MSEIKWTQEDLAEFDQLLELTSSIRQMDRISGRLDLARFVRDHGEEKCKAMFEHLETRPK